MTTRIGVVHPSDVVRSGLAAELRALGEVETPQKAAAWVLESGPKILLHPRATTADHEAVTHLATTGRDVRIVALLDGRQPEGFRMALRAGCAGAVDINAPAGEIVAVVEAVQRDMVLLPANVAQVIATTAHADPPDTIWLSSIERLALQMLGDGAKTNEIADACGYSERETFRILGDLYSKLGVANRSQAIATAARWGLIHG